MRPTLLRSLAAVADALTELGQLLAMLIWLTAGVLWSHREECSAAEKSHEDHNAAAT